jgi:hypothetical protein
MGKQGRSLNRAIEHGREYSRNILALLSTLEKADHPAAHRYAEYGLKNKDFRSFYNSWYFFFISL